MIERSNQVEIFKAEYVAQFVGLTDTEAIQEQYENLVGLINQSNDETEKKARLEALKTSYREAMKRSTEGRVSEVREASNAVSQVYEKYKQGRQTQGWTSEKEDSGFMKGLADELKTKAHWTDPTGFEDYFRAVFAAEETIEAYQQADSDETRYDLYEQIKKDLILAREKEKEAGGTRVTTSRQLLVRLNRSYNEIAEDIRTFIPASVFESLEGNLASEFSYMQQLFNVAMKNVRNMGYQEDDINALRKQKERVTSCYQNLTDGLMWLSAPQHDRMKSFIQMVWREYQAMIGEDLNFPFSEKTEDIVFTWANYTPTTSGARTIWKLWCEADDLWSKLRTAELAGQSLKTTFDQDEIEKIKELKEDSRDTLNYYAQYHDQHRLEDGQERLQLLFVIDNRLGTLLSKHKETEASNEAWEGLENNEQLTIIIRMYDELRTKNPNLPEFREIDPEDSVNFVYQLNKVIVDLYRDALVKDIASGGGFRKVNTTTNLWSDELIDTGSTNIKGSFEFFINHFPWYLLTNAFSQEDEISPEYHKVRTEIQEKYKMRLLHIGCMENLAYIFSEIDDKELSWMSNIKKVYEQLKGLQEESGYQTWDLSTVHDRFWYVEEDEQTTAVLEGIFCGESEAGRHLEDPNWLLMEYVNLFMNRIERAGDNSALTPFPINSNAGAKNLNTIRIQTIQELPEELRERDEQMIDLAFSIAQWNEMHTLKIYDKDHNAVHSKFARGYNSQHYMPKLWPKRMEANDLGSMSFGMTAPKVGLHREHFIQVLVDIGGAYEEVDVDDYVASAKANQINDPHTYEQYLQIAIRAGDRDMADSTSVVGANEAIKQRYRLIKITDTAFGLVGDVIAVPKAFFEVAQQKGQPHLVQMSLQDVRSSLVDTQRVLFESMTTHPTSTYYSWMDDYFRFYPEFGVVDSQEGFTEIHNSELQKLVRSRPTYNFLRELRDIRRKLRMLLHRNKFSKDAAIRTDKILRDNFVSVQAVPSEWLTAGGDKEREGVIQGFNSSEVTKVVWGYAIGQVMKAGPFYPEREADNSLSFSDEVELLEPYSFLFGQLSHLIFEEGGFANLVEKMTEDSTDKIDVKKARINTRLPINPEVRKAIDLFNQYLITGESSRKEKAKNIILVELFTMALGAYLDRYAPLSFLVGKPIRVTVNYETDYQNVKTFAGVRPMSFVDRALLLAIVGAQYKWFDDNLIPPPDFIPDRDYIMGMMERRGIIGTPEQVAVDRWELEEGKFKDNKE